MYAEIKTDNKIIINRLDDSERLLLQNICNDANTENSKIVISEIIDSTGDFGGITLTVTPGGPKQIEVSEAMPTKLDLPIGEDASIVVNTNVPNNDIRILTFVKSDNITVDTTNNIIYINATDTQEVGTQSLYYTVAADGCLSYNGIIEVNTVARAKANVKINVIQKDSPETVVEDCTITIKDTDDTTMLQNEDKTFDLPVGSYNIEIAKEGYDTLVNTLEIVSADLNVTQVEKSYELTLN